jgi:hypothetical protein
MPPFAKNNAACAALLPSYGQRLPSLYRKTSISEAKRGGKKKMNVAKREQRQPPTWPEIQGELKQYLTARDATVWQRWFEPVTGIVEQGENNTLTLRLVCPTNFYGNWIRDNYEIWVFPNKGTESFTAIMKNLVEVRN